MNLAVQQHKEIGDLQAMLAEGKSLEAILANLLKGYRDDHDQADPWGSCDCKKCRTVDQLLVKA